MRVPLSWLAEFVAIDGPVGTLVDRLVMGGLKVESIDEVGRVDVLVRVGRIVEVEQHPDAERLQVCRVDVGGTTRVTVVSAAPGLRGGLLVPVALPGATLASGTTVRAAALRGVESGGMLCAESELGLGDDATQVLALPADAVVGTPLVELPGITDTVLEFEVTPNRGDWLSIVGIAREIAALTGARLRRRPPTVRESGAEASAEITLRIEAPDLCPRYAARLVRGVRAQPSPLETRLRLRRAGMRPINAVVDATNVVMLERGQPLHAFDFDRIAERTVVVRRARAGERLVTLDGAERVLEGDDLVIADPRGPIAIAGVMGGRETEVTDATSTVLLESAHFLPTSVRRTRRRLGITSQAAYRFERRVDPAVVPEAVDALAALIARHAGGRPAPGVVEQAPGLATLAAPTIVLRPRRAQALLGMRIPRGEMARRLRALGARCRPSGDAIAVTPPTWRSDLHLEEDLVEEIVRVGGYDAVPTTLPDAPIGAGADSPARLHARRIRRLLVAQGLTEMVTLAFTDERTNRMLPGCVARGLAPIPVRNPLSSESGQMRRSPLAGLLAAARGNAGRGATFVGAYELGKGYGLDGDGQRHERRAVCILLYGRWPARGVERDGPAVDFLDLKGVVTNLLVGLGGDEATVRWDPAADVPFLHPGKAAIVRAAGAVVGVAGGLHPEIVQTFDLAGEVWLAELDFESLSLYVPRRFTPRALPRHPAVTRDIAVVVEEGFLADTILEEVRSFGDSRIESARLFDCYRGAPIAAGRKSLAYTIAYRASDRTLTDDEVNALHARLRDHLRARFALELRS